MTATTSHLDWYRRDPAYVSVEKSLVPIGSHGVHLLRAFQPAGVYHRPAADEITLQMPLRSGVDAALDHGTRFPVRSRSMHFVLGPSDTDLQYDVRSDCELLTAVIPKSAFVTLNQSGRSDFGRLHAEQFSDDMVSAVLVRMWRAASDEHPVATLFADSAMATLALALSARAEGRRWSGDHAPGRAAGGGLAGWQLRRVQDAMDAQLDGEMSLSSLADIAGLSPTHFSRAFKQSTGLSPFNWLRGRRIERAKDLLADPRIPLAEIALAVGFSAQPEFTTAFKRATGATPGAWRRERLL